MSGIDRRGFVGATAAGLFGGLVSDGAATESAQVPASSDVPADVTRTLAAPDGRYRRSRAQARVIADVARV